MITDIKKILNELSYRVHDGSPDFENEQHLIKLYDVLKEFKWPVDARIELIKTLTLTEGTWWDKLDGPGKAKYIAKHGGPPKRRDAKDLGDTKDKQSTQDKPSNKSKSKQSDKPKKKKAFPKTAKDKEWTGDSADDIADKVSSEGAPKVIPTKGPEDVRERVLADREKIFSGEKTGKGGGDTTIQEEMANIGREIANEPDYDDTIPLQDQIIARVKRDYPDTDIAKDDKKLKKLSKNSSAGARTMNKLKNNKQWGYNSNQPDGHPVNTTDNIVVRDNLITNLKKAEEDGDGEAIKHYKKELYFYQKKATDKSVTGKEGDADTMIIYTDNEGRTRVAYVTNKQTINDQMSSSTINGTKKSIEKNADKYFDKKTKANGVKKINEIVTEQHSKSSQFNTSYCNDTKKVVKKNRKGLKKVSKALGIAVNIDDKGGKTEYHTGGTNDKYTKEAQKAPEVQANLLGEDGAPNNDVKSKEYKTWKKGIAAKWKEHQSNVKKGKSKPFGAEDTVQSVLDTTGTGGLNSIGNGSSAAPYSLVKTLIRTQKVRTLMKECVGDDPSRIKECAAKVAKAPSKTDKTKVLYGGVFGADDVEDIYNSKELEKLEQVERQRGKDLSDMYDETTSQLKDEDAKMGITGVPPKNGPHTKAYVKGFLDRTHLSDYISGDVDGRVMAEFGSDPVSPTDFRRALAKILEFDGDPDDTEALEVHILENVVPTNSKQSLIYVNKNNEKIVIGVDTHRTGGRDSKVGGQYGPALKTALVEQSEKSQKDIETEKQKSKEKK